MMMMTMMNSSQPSFFLLAAYADLGPLRYLYFVVVLLLYVVIVGANLLLILVICVNRSLHEPMYMFLLSLFVNELYGSTGLFPLILVQILADVHTVAAPLCYLQIFCGHSYASIEFFVLAGICYDRYLAICRPLQYHRLMVLRRVVALTVIMWLLPFLGIFALIALSFSLQLCGNVIHKVSCSNYSIVKLACGDTSVNNIYGLLYAVYTIFLPLALILFTYLRILKVCFSGSSQTRQKALSTCSPHIASVINFSFGCCFEVMQSRFDMSRVPDMLRIFLSLYFLTCQPLFTPLMYGLKMSKIRNVCKSLFSLKTQ